MASTKKTIYVLILAAILIGTGFVVYSMYTTGDWVDGAPEAQINCRIQAITGSSSFGGGANINENSDIGGAQSFTTFTSTIPTLDANTQYTISFSASMTTKTAKFGEALTNAISVTGVTGGSASGKTYLATGDIASSSASVAGTAGGTSTLAIPGFVKRSTASTPVVIMGDVIDGSIFTFTITSTATDGRTSSTTATLTITVTSGGTIYLTIDNITTTLAAALYPAGWNVPGNVNYMVVTNSNTSYRIDFYDHNEKGNSAFTFVTIERTINFLNSLLSANAITRIQYDCGMAQIISFGG
jgi:hypothetical protein